MGSCVSRSTTAAAGLEKGIPTAMVVVASDGSMAQYAAPVTAHEALEGARRLESCFVCSSDELYFDAPVRALAARDALQAGQLYFVLPLSMLDRPLSGQDMAALAVKASAALGADGVGVVADRPAAGVASKGKNGGEPAVKHERRRQKGRVAPLAAEGEHDGYRAAGGYENDAYKTVSGDLTVGKTRNGVGHRSGTAHRRAATQRLGAIAEGNE